MLRSVLNEDGSRKLLARIIMEVIQEWPEIDRRVFVAAHYDGQSPDRVASVYEMTRGEVRSILERCERHLHDALREFRHPDHFDSGMTAAHPVKWDVSSCAR